MIKLTSNLIKCFVNHKWVSKCIDAKFAIFWVLLASFLAILRNLGHTAIHYWDEGFHAIVARNLLKHPLTFTLYDQPWLPYDYKGWGANHIWLHKPPLAMWKIAISYWALGVNTLALRLPSAILATIAIWITYRIATDLFDRRAGLIAAFLQGFNPFLFGSIHGYNYSDHIDIALLFWVEVSCWLLIQAIRSGALKLYILCGIAQGLAYLSKSYLALITFGIAIVIWGAGWTKILNLPAERIKLRDIIVQLLSSILTVTPWTAYCLIKHPKEYIWEHKRVLDHLSTDVESWGATWDRPIFDYMIQFYPIIYTIIIGAALCLILTTLKNRSFGEFFISAWIAGVIVPHSYALTKTPSATMIATPAIVICLSVIISKSWRKNDWFYTTSWFALTLSTMIIKGGKSLVKGRDQFDKLNKLAPYLETNFWIIKQLLVFGIILGGLFLCRRLTHRLRWQKWLWLSLRFSVLGISILYAQGYIDSSIAVTNKNVNHPLYQTIGKKIRTDFPQNACFFLDHPDHGTHFYLMFYADRSVYQTTTRDAKQKIVDRDLQKLATQVRAAGGIPYLVSITKQDHNYDLVFEAKAENVINQTYQIYALKK